MKHRAKAIFLVLAALAFAAAPALSPGFDGFDPDRFPVPQLDPPVQPAGWAFAIWGPIYLLLVSHAAYGLWRHRDDPAWDDLRWPLILSLGVGSLWLAVANVSPIIATVLIWVMLVSALAALVLSPGRHLVTDAGASPAPAANRWLGRVPIGLYTGWLTAASWVSIGLLLGGWGVLGPVTAALVALPLAIAFAAIFQLWLGRAPEYGLTVIWALAGLVAANWSRAPAIAALAAVGILVMGVILLRLGNLRTERWGPER
ncbi:hypothetical protein [Halodurantibacterium flavum]|uniref:Tryptophan-rich sensory protein n=1 Tax=Halodurantibacterium flavum TaxID=1382802 RepID=A0ABW4S9N2_9RHOB